VLSVCALHFLVHGSDVEEEWVFNKEVQLNQYKGPGLSREKTWLKRSLYCYLWMNVHLMHFNLL